jgi:hypothetical protein
MSSQRIDDETRRVAIGLAWQGGWSPQAAAQIGEGMYVPQWCLHVSEAMQILKQQKALQYLIPPPIENE